MTAYNPMDPFGWERRQHEWDIKIHAQLVTMTELLSSIRESLEHLTTKEN